MKRTLSLLLVLVLFCSAALPARAADDAPGVPARLTITLDPGHGGRSPGAVATQGGVTYIERDLCMKIANYLKEYLEEYPFVKVYLTHEDASGNPGLEERVQMASENGSDVLVSLHLNASNGSVSGSMVLVTIGTWDPLGLKPIEDALARSILGELNGQLGLPDRGLWLRRSEEEYYPNGKVADYYAIIRHGINYGVPSILIEHCFIDNARDRSLALSSEAGLRALAKADADGIAKYYGLQKTDYAAHPLRACVDHARERGWMNGYPDGSFQPDAALSRAMFAALLQRFDPPIPAPDSGDEAEEPVFSDVAPDDWFAENVLWAHSRGLIQGFPDGVFLPDAEITFEQMAAILARCLRAAETPDAEPLPADDADDTDADADTNTDADACDDDCGLTELSDWAREDAALCFRAGLFEGVFAPGTSARSAVTRAQLCAALCRLEQHFSPAAAEAEAGAAGAD